MSDTADAETPLSEPKRPRTPTSTLVARWVVVAVVVLLLTLIALAVWWVTTVATHGLAVKRDLEQAQTGVAKVKTQLLALDSDGAADTYHQVARHTSDAVHQTDDPLWRAAEGVPYVGKNLKVVRQLTSVTDDTVVALGPAVDLMHTLNPAKLAPKDGALPIEPVVKAVPVVHNLRGEVNSLSARVKAIDTSHTVRQLPAAQKQLAGVLDGVKPQLEFADNTLPILPKLLGADAPRSYIIAFQNNAELRSTGGTVLSFARISVDKGKIQLVESIPAGASTFPQFAGRAPIMPIGDFDKVFPNVLGRTVANSTMRPSFTTAAQLIQKFWADYRHVNADAIISVDAVQLSYLLRATGPIQLSTGDTIDQNNVVPLLLNQVYQRYNTGNLLKDNANQDAVYSAAVGATFSRIGSGQVSLTALVQAVLTGAAERRFELYDTHPDEQALIQGLNLITSAEPPSSNDKLTQVGLYTNDNGGTKLGYYLASTATVSVGACAPGRSVARVSMQYTNTLSPRDAPRLSRSIAGLVYQRFGIPKGAISMILFGYAPPGAQIIGATSNGKRPTAKQTNDGINPVQRMIMTIPAGKTQTATLDVLLPDGSDKKDVQLLTTPGVNATTVTVDHNLDCSTVRLPK